MGEEVKMTDYESGSGTGTGSGDDDRVFDWESGLPGFDDLTPLSQTLIPPDLMSAFRISPEPSRSMVDVNRESQKTFTSIRAHHQFHSVSSSPAAAATAADAIVVDVDDADPTLDGSDSRKSRRITDNGDGGATEDGDSSAAQKGTENGGGSGALKRARLVWTPQLHKRFVDVVAHLGIKNAVPKTIMQLMNVEGLTRENVASHLQKYRLYLKRMQGLSSEGPTSSDQLFASTPVPQSLHEPAASGAANGHMPMPMQMAMPYPPPAPVPMMGGGFHGYEAHHQYGMMHMQQPIDWSGNKYPYQHLPHHVAHNEN